MSDQRIVIIGGVATGLKAASRARRLDHKAEITVVEQGEFISYAACGLPYWISGAIGEGQSLWPRDVEHFRSHKGITVLTRTRAETIDRRRKIVGVRDLSSDDTRELPYDQLVLATGSTAFVPPIPGKELQGVFTLSSPADAQAIQKALAEDRPQRAVIVGGGPIGLEMAEALSARGLEVTLVEMMNRLLPALLDEDMSHQVAQHLRQKGVNLLLGRALGALEGDQEGRVRRAIAGGEVLEADLVILALGVRPNVELAKEARLELGPTGAIAVDDHLRTSDPHIYAGGDCVQNWHLITGKPVYMPLGSTANKHGRVIGTNVAGGDDVFPGVLGTGIVKVFDLNVGKTGLTEEQALQEGYEPVVALIPAQDLSDYYPGAKAILVKLVAEADTGRLLGAQVLGPGDVAKRVDIVATALSFGATARGLSFLDLAYAPPYSPAMDSVITAANVLRNKLEELCKGLPAASVRGRLDRGEDFVLLDVRTPGEHRRKRLAEPQTLLLPLDELRERAGELPKAKPLVAVCERGVRAYQATRLLESIGFREVQFMDGGLACWPYELSREPGKP